MHIFINRDLSKCASKSGIWDTHLLAYFKTQLQTNLLRNNTNLLLIQDFLENSSVQNTQMYTNIVNEDLRKAYLKSHTM